MGNRTKRALDRYLEALAVVDDPTPAIRQLDGISPHSPWQSPLPRIEHPSRDRWHGAGRPHFRVPGMYDEFLVMWKPVQSKGWGPASTNKMIADNVAALAGGAISLHDAVRIEIIRNTLVNKDSSGTAAPFNCSINCRESS